ncbi:MAG: signal peptidase I [Candidatus Woesearchaeota archaeon]
MINRSVVWNYVILYVFGIITVLAFTLFPTANAQNPVLQLPSVNTDATEVASPSNYITQQDISVYRDRVIINAENIKWATFADTKSMLPTINKHSYALQIEPRCPEQIEVGDIISYTSNYATGIIIHRVVHKDEDNQGPYFILKGDNNPTNDPGKIRCDQIDRKVIAIIY